MTARNAGRPGTGRRRWGATVAGLVAALLAIGVAPSPAGAATTAAGSPSFTDGASSATTSAAIDSLATPSVAGADDATVDSITRLYLAVFGRLPDPDGHRYWVEQRVAGLELADIATVFIRSDEWGDRYGPVGAERFVDLLYHHVLQRPADDEGKRYWVAALAATPRTDVLLHFSESTEFVHRTGTAEPPSPFPPVPAGSGSGRRIVYDNDGQRVWLVEADGSVHDSYAVSGRRDTPKPGVYAVFSKSPKAWAGHGGITMNHMVRFTRGRSLAIGFHSIPIRPGGRPLQTLAALGTYQSAGCVRQSDAKAELLYHWADVGTTVVVLD